MVFSAFIRVFLAFRRFISGFWSSGGLTGSYRVLEDAGGFIGFHKNFMVFVAFW